MYECSHSQANSNKCQLQNFQWPDLFMNTMVLSAGSWDFDGARPGTDARPVQATRATGNPISREEAFQQLENSFDSQPLPISHSLRGPLPASVPPLNLSGAKEQDGSGASTTTALPAMSNGLSLAPKGLRIPGSAFQVTAPHQVSHPSESPVR